MKKYSLLLPLLLMLLSCSSTDMLDVADKEKDISVEFRFKKRHLSRVEDIRENNKTLSEINSLDLVLLEDERIIKIHSLTDKELEAFKASGKTTFQYIYSKAPSITNRIAIIANKIEDVDYASFAKTTSLKEAILRTKIEKLQPSSKYPGISNTILFDSKELVATNKKNPDTDNYIYKVEMAVEPQIARIQMTGVIRKSDKIKDLAVTRIYLDNFIESNIEKSPSYINVKTTSGDALDQIYEDKGLIPVVFDSSKQFTESFPLNTLLEEDKTYAYHVFPQANNKENTDNKDKDANIKLLLKLEYTLSSDESIRYIEYATLRLADEKLSNTSMAIESGKIYSINLDQIDWNSDGDIDEDDKFEPGYGGETPNAKDKLVYVEVEVIDWTEEVIKPEL